MQVLNYLFPAPVVCVAPVDAKYWKAMSLWMPITHWRGGRLKLAIHLPVSHVVAAINWWWILMRLDTTVSTSVLSQIGIGLLPCVTGYCFAEGAVNTSV